MAKSNDWIQIQYKPGDILLPELQFETVARLMYLATFIDKEGCIPTSVFGGCNTAHSIKCALLSRLRMKQVWKLWEFLDDVESAGIFEVKDDGCYFRTSAILSGDTKCRLPKGFKRIYINKEAIRELFEQNGYGKHRDLGMLFRMMPFLKNNPSVLSSTPTAKNWDVSNWLTLKDYCSLMGYTRPVSNLHNYLCNLSFVNEIGEKSHPILFGNEVFKRGAVFMNPYLCRKSLSWKATLADKTSIAITSERK